MEPVADIQPPEPAVPRDPRELPMNQREAGAIERIVALAFAAWIFDFYDLILYSFLLVPVARELHLTPEQSSIALGTSLLMTALGGVIFGFLGDRFGRKPMIAATVAIYGVGTALCGFSHTLPQLIVFRSITGLGMGGGWAPGQSLVAESAPAERRARYAAYVQTGAPLGVLLAAAAGGYLAPAIGWRLTFMISAIPAVFVVAAVLKWMPESDVWQRTRIGPNRGVDLRAILVHKRIFVLLFVVVLLNSEAYWFTYTWMPGYLELKRGLTAAGASRMMMKMQIGGVLGYLTFGRVADRLGRRPAFCAYGMLMAAGTIPPTVLWNSARAVPGLISAAMFTAGFGTGIWSGVAPMIAELLPTRIRNTALGLLLNVTRGFQFFTPILIAVLGARFGFGATLSLGAVFSTLGALMVWILPETRGRSITALD
ncbi:MFS transporter [Candidatus Binatus sp.]|jgi:MFS family permease|uniref:MFS transporter n=1 Tax=Candidatus Binatus sp. TaxID=2811406 RepID=UPI003BEC10AA